MDFTTNERLQLVRDNVIFQYLNVLHNLIGYMDFMWGPKKPLIKVFLHK